MPSSEIIRRVALARTDVPEEPSASIISVTRIGELQTEPCCEEMLSMMEAILSYDTSVLTRAARRNNILKRRADFSWTSSKMDTTTGAETGLIM
jgi:hypothetical protein